MGKATTTVHALTVRVIAVGGFDLLARAVHRGTSIEYCLQYVLYPWGPVGGEWGSLDVFPNLYPGHHPLKPPANSAPEMALPVAVGDTIIDTDALGSFGWFPSYAWVPKGRKEPILFTPPKTIYKDYPQCLLAKSYIEDGKRLGEIQLRRAYGVNIFQDEQVIKVLDWLGKWFAIQTMSLPNGDEYETIVGSYLDSEGQPKRRIGIASMPLSFTLPAPKISQKWQKRASKLVVEQAGRVSDVSATYSSGILKDPFYPVLVPMHFDPQFKHQPIYGLSPQQVATGTFKLPVPNQKSSAKVGPLKSEPSGNLMASARVAEFESFEPVFDNESPDWLPTVAVHFKLVYDAAASGKP